MSHSMIQWLLFWICTSINCLNGSLISKLNESLKVFDWQFYLEVNRDITTSGFLTEVQAKNHYIRYGNKDNRWINASMIPSYNGCIYGMDIIIKNPKYSILCPRLKELKDRLNVFDWKFYLEANPDLIPIKFNTSEAALNHFKMYGYLEKRWINASELPSPRNCMLVEAMINNSNPFFLSACRHRGLLSSSKKRNLKQSHALEVFDWKFYLKLNPDLVAGGISSEESAVDHFTKYGIHEHRWGSPKLKPSLVACTRASQIIAANIEYQNYCIGKTFVDYACEKDDELEALVTTSPTRTINFIISHDDGSTHVADAYGKCRDWIYNVKFGASKFFESEIYNYLLERPKQLLSYDYIMISTYKTIEMVASELKGYLKYAKQESYDCIPFLRSHAGFTDQFRHRHGTVIIKAWDLLLQKLGYSLTVIREFDKVKPFYRSTFLIKPDVLLKLSAMMQNAMTLTNKDNVLKTAFSQDAKYVNGSEEQAMKSFGTRYYQYHPFIFERLPVFFLYMLGVKVCIDQPTGPCVANTEFFHYHGKKLVIDDQKRTFRG